MFIIATPPQQPARIAAAVPTTTGDWCGTPVPPRGTITTQPARAHAEAGAAALVHW